jgi:hypothetical protein
MQARTRRRLPALTSRRLALQSISHNGVISMAQSDAISVPTAAEVTLFRIGIMRSCSLVALLI